MISRTQDVTSQFNDNSKVNVEVGKWQNIVVQIVSPTGTVNFNSTNDAGDVAGVSDGDASTALNFGAVQGTNLATGAAVTSLAATGRVSFGIIGQFLQLIGTSVTATKVLIFFTKPY